MHDSGLSGLLLSTALPIMTVALTAAALSTAAASAADITISNGAGPAAIFVFGPGQTETMGEVFTPPVSGTLTSFSLSLAVNGTSTGGVGELFGGVGAWNGGPDPGNTSAGSPINLYQSPDFPSTGIQTFTFTPDIRVLAGEQYVAYLSVYGVTGAQGEAGMTGFLGANLVPGINYFVLTGGTDVDPRGNSNWEGCACNFTAQFSATFTVPEPSTWAMLLVGFVGFSFADYWASRRGGAPA